MATTKTQRLKLIFEQECQKYFEQDRWGNFKFSSHGNQYRIKIQKTSWRLEVRLSTSWKKISGTHYNNKVISPEEMVQKICIAHGMGVEK